MKRCRLIYQSVALPETLKPESLSGLGEQCAKNNARDGINGLLVLSGDRFLQVLEGPVKFVNELFGRIMVDPRHEQVQLIAYESLAESYFYDWSMRTLQLDTLPDPSQEDLRRKYQHREGTILVPDDRLLVYSLLLDARTLCRDLAGAS